MNINDFIKKKKIKKVSFAKEVKSNNNSDSKSNESFNNLFPNINKFTPRKKNIFININPKIINKNNSEIFDNKNLFPQLNYNTFNKKQLTPLNNYSILQASKRFNQPTNLTNKHISLKKSIYKPLNNSLNKEHSPKNKKRASISYKLDLDKFKIENNLVLNEHEKELSFNSEPNSINNNIRKMSKSRTEAYIHFKKSKNNSLPFLNNYNSFNNSSIREKNFSQLSKSRNVTARKIFNYYISQESKDKFTPIKNFERFIKKKYKNPKNRFNKIYCLNKLHLQRIKELKNNRIIAYKDDFNIKDYQYTLLELIRNRVGNNNLFSLGQNYKEFNEKLNKKIKPKGRFTNLADKLRNNAPSYLINRLKQLDRDKLIARAKYLNSSINFDENKKFKKVNIFREFNLYMKNKNKKNNKDKK